ncbi:serine/threonine-protein kinase [Chondromyces apiculatus]|uniref:Serine/threonine kinase Pkn10 n=1 Tax=Chondromyces apiculatus DSM 436 TaxID=1192034 RepID=A0A017TA21_9BACT|nr:serine/threonine-protein kinase [Chondromyces apiculatus]EYF05787.1 serine/threonine kinase Pkn10 [Chondromyces apiculatus DSM 436]
MTTSSYAGHTAFGATLDAPTLNDAQSGALDTAPTLLGHGRPTGAPLETLASPAHSRSSAPPPSSASRATTLPRVEGQGSAMRLIPEVRARYQTLKVLGAGGMGEVFLVHDNDIVRKVAVKRLLSDDTSPATLARFVDEIRTVGRLEHPSIVPIHDVGIDEEGRYYFVMKYVEGETLESIIERLVARDPAYHRKYTIERRCEIFVALLHALAYAHAHGIVHRDIKPANIMVGRFGEVMLMDWGIAKPITAENDHAASAQGTLATLGDAGKDERARLYATRIGTLVGTPAYMSPEQARGDNDQIDSRSDLYSAAVVFHELLTLHHYLSDRRTIDQMLTGVMSEEFSNARLYGSPAAVQARIPGELMYFVARGIEKAPADRFQSADEMIESLQMFLSGQMEVTCHVTLQKRILSDMGRFIDKHSRAGMFILLFLTATVLFSAIQIVRMIVA